MTEADRVRIIDISQPVGVATAAWPGDEPVRLRWTMRQDEGASVNVAAVSMSVHNGTHVDGPYHVAGAGAPVAELALESFVGPAVVVDAVGREALDGDAIAGVDLGRAERILFRTRGHVDATRFPERFAAPTPELARTLVGAGVRLVGTDAPSVDPVDSKTLDAHRILAAGGVAIVENLVLTDVRPGRYTLVVLPLRLVGADSAPARAILVEGRIDVP